MSSSHTQIANTLNLPSANVRQPFKCLSKWMQSTSYKQLLVPSISSTLHHHPVRSRREAQIRVLIDYYNDDSAPIDGYCKYFDDSRETPFVSSFDKDVITLFSKEEEVDAVANLDTRMVVAMVNEVDLKIIHSTNCLKVAVISVVWSIIILIHATFY